VTTPGTQQAAGQGSSFATELGQRAATETSFGGAATTTLAGLGGKASSSLIVRPLEIALGGPFGAGITTLVTDAANGVWTLGYLPKLIDGLKAIGVQTAGGDT